jgi:hypothetical protein
MPDTGYKDISYPWGLTADTANNNLFTCGQLQTVLHNGKWEHWYGNTMDNFSNVIPYKNKKNIYFRTYYENNNPTKYRTAVLRFSTASDMDTLFKLVGHFIGGSFVQYNGMTICPLISNGGNIINYNNLVQFTDTGVGKINDPRWSFLNTRTGGAISYKNKLYLAGSFDSSIAVLNPNNWEILKPGINGSNKSISGLITYNNRLYVLGGFWKFEDQNNPGNSIAAWDGEKWDSLGGGTKNVDIPINSGFNAGVVCGGKLFLCGLWTQVGDLKHKYRIVSWNDTSWCSMGADIGATSGYIQRLACLQDTLYAAGDFSDVNGKNLGNVAKFVNINHVDTCGNPRYKIIYTPEEDFDFKFYPNPVKDKLTIQFMPNKLNFNFLRIDNSLGQTVYILDTITSKQEIDLSFLASGVYYLKIQGNSEQKVFKIIKE